jgi:hypothetical protein
MYYEKGRILLAKNDHGIRDNGRITLNGNDEANPVPELFSILYVMHFSPLGSRCCRCTNQDARRDS